MWLDYVISNLTSCAVWIVAGATGFLLWLRYRRPVPPDDSYLRLLSKREKNLMKTQVADLLLIQANRNITLDNFTETAELLQQKNEVLQCCVTKVKEGQNYWLRKRDGLQVDVQEIGNIPVNDVTNHELNMEPFDLAEGPCWRLRILPEPNQRFRYHLLFMMSSVLCETSKRKSICDEYLAALDAIVGGRRPTLLNNHKIDMPSTIDDVIQCVVSVLSIIPVVNNMLYRIYFTDNASSVLLMSNENCTTPPGGPQTRHLMQRLCTAPTLTLQSACVEQRCSINVVILVAMLRAISSQLQNLTEQLQLCVTYHNHAESDVTVLLTFSLFELRSLDFWKLVGVTSARINASTSSFTARWSVALSSALAKQGNYRSTLEFKVRQTGSVSSRELRVVRVFSVASSHAAVIPNAPISLNLSEVDTHQCFAVGYPAHLLPSAIATEITQSALDDLIEQSRLWQRKGKVDGEKNI